MALFSMTREKDTFSLASVNPTTHASAPSHNRMSGRCECVAESSADGIGTHVPSIVRPAKSSEAHTAPVPITPAASWPAPDEPNASGTAAAALTLMARPRAKI